ncbi:MAG: hypothetical protein JRH06_16245 [Deltaproteobacteria bacterium]|nr:hypothetical protein [Deltaproteobacteria bacterium]MBW2139088.1 hypothetical protein [Deltaproteobacteria bacterium]
MFESLRRSALPARNSGILRRPSSTRPTIWLVEENGIRAVVKDFSSNGFLYRNTIGRFLIWRETKAYRRLKGLEGVPRFYRVMDGLALVVEEIKGRSMEGLEDEITLSEDFFRSLKDLVKAVHDRGLAHCDLKRAPNVLMGEDGHPYIIDWCSAITRSEFRFFPLSLIYDRFLQDDFNAIIKLQLRHCPDSVTSPELDRYHSRGRAERFIRNMRDRARAVLQRIA